MQKKLVEAREAQASAMSRFIQARARVMQVEARLQAMQASLVISQMPADQTSEPTDLAGNSGISEPDATPSKATNLASNSAISKPDATPAAQVIIPPVNSSYTQVQATDALTSASSVIAEQTPPPHKQFRTPATKPSLISEQAVNNSTRAPDNTLSVRIDEEEDEEETKKMPALRPIRSASAARRNPDAEEMANATLSTLPQSERSDLASVGNETREVGATDITAKIPVIRQEHDQARESL